MNEGLEELRRRYPWPDACPDVPLNPDGWFCGENRAVLQRLVANADVVLELGAWLGMSSRYLVEWTRGTVITIDHWKGSAEHQNRPELPTLWETFVRNAWDSHRDRLIPVRADVLDGAREVHDLGVVPNVVYVDAAHDADSVCEQLKLIMKLWPTARIVGDDWTWLLPGQVRDGVYAAIGDSKRVFIPRTTCYEILPEGADANL